MSNIINRNASVVNQLVTPPKLKLSGLLALLLAASVTLTACGGGGGGGGGGGSNIVPSLGEASQNPTSQANIAAAAAAGPKEGSVTQSSNTEDADNPTTTDSVEVEVTYNSESGKLDYSAVKTAGAGGGIGATISSTVDMVLARADGEIVDGEASDKYVELYKKLPDGQLWVDIYTDNTPDIDISSTPSGVVDVPTGSMVKENNFFSSDSGGGGISIPGTFNGQTGQLSCSSGCGISAGVTTDDTWTFTPDSAGATGGVPVPTGSLLGREIDGIDGRLAYSGIFGGQQGIISCSLSAGCGTVTTNGIRRADTGAWTFIPNSGGSAESVVVVTQDTDYLAGGIWVYAPNDADSLSDYEYGAFGDGNDPFTRESLMGLTGEATYSGSQTATGVYADTSTERNTFFNADVHLTADFSTDSGLGTIHGRIDNFVEDTSSGAEGGDMVAATKVFEDASPVVMLESASITNANNGGFFTNDTETMTEFNEQNYEGKWGGSFFGNPASGASGADLQPGSIGGTFGAASTGDGPSRSILGVFGAFKQ